MYVLRKTVVLIGMVALLGSAGCGSGNGGSDSKGTQSSRSDQGTVADAGGNSDTTVSTDVKQGAQIECGKALKKNNPLSGTCAKNLVNIFICFDPKGECTIKMDGSITWANGAKITTNGIGGTDIKSEFRSPKGKRCGILEVKNANDANVPVVLTNASGESWKQSTLPDGSTEIECSNGQKVTLTQQDSDAFSSCGGNPSSCSIEGLPNGGVPGVCSTDKDCTGDLTCCKFSGSSNSFCARKTDCPN